MVAAKRKSARRRPGPVPESGREWACQCSRHTTAAQRFSLLTLAPDLPDKQPAGGARALNRGFFQFQQTQSRQRDFVFTDEDGLSTSLGAMAKACFLAIVRCQMSTENLRSSRNAKHSPISVWGTCCIGSMLIQPIKLAGHEKR